MYQSKAESEGLKESGFLWNCIAHVLGVDDDSAQSHNGRVSHIVSQDL